MPRKTNKTETTPEVAETTETAAQATEGPQLTLADVKNAVNVIDHAAAQGAFKGWETIAQVMQVRTRLANFVEAASPKVEGAAEGTTEEVADNADITEAANS